MGVLRKSIAGWGCYPVQICELQRPESPAGLHNDVAPLIARGLGRSYGDAALNDEGRVLLTERLNRLLSFDATQGVLRAEAGTTLAEILRLFVPRGWFPVVVPGTRHVTLGGCVAADVHGKNHHRDGAFSQHLTDLQLLTAAGKRLRCSPTREKDAFWATVGGMGLTGVITEVGIRMRPIDSAYLVTEHQPTADLDQTLAYLDDNSFDDEYTVAWLDGLATGASLGRGVFMRGHHAAVADLPVRLRDQPLAISDRGTRRVPMNLPSGLLHPALLRIFNSIYYQRQGARRQPFVVDYSSFFHPLDALDDWNRLYGKLGFLQYQCAVPAAGGVEVLREILRRLAEAGYGSFLAVLKKFGAASKGMLSFPLPGYTLAVDIPRRGETLLALLDELDDRVAGCGGRVYLAKDARLSPVAFRRMYPRFGDWHAIKQRLDPHQRFSSSLSRRLRLEAGP